MVLGRSIKIYLADSSTSGLRHAEIVNWTGQAIALPRNRVKELSDWPEASRPGVYLLLGRNEEDSSAVYIGEAESVVARLKSHVADKEFWNEVVLFTSKDDNLTKAHVKYLESRLVAIAHETGRYSILNSNSPSLPVLPRGERDAMEEFSQNIIILLGALGHRLLEPLAKVSNTNSSSQTTEVNPATVEKQILSLFTKGLRADALISDEGVVVLKNSQAALDIKSSLSDGYVVLRKELIAQKVLRREADCYVFQKDHLFASPSQAAAIVIGMAVNGRMRWLDSSGRTLKQLEAEELNLSDAELSGDPVNPVLEGPEDLSLNPEYVSRLGS